MPSETIRSLLEHIKGYHHKLSSLYSQTAESTEQQKVKMLLHYLKRHEIRFEEVISDCEEEIAANVLDTWFCFTPDKLPELKGTEINAHMSLDAIIEAALRFDDILITFCRHVAEKSVTPEVRDLFNSLVQMEEQEERRAIKAADDL